MTDCAPDTNKTPAPAGEDRRQAGLDWARRQLNLGRLDCADIAGDASFRRYFRLSHNDSSWVLMDAPPNAGLQDAFVDIDRRLLAAGLRAPRIKAMDLEQGYLLLEDLGERLLRDELDPNDPNATLQDCFEAIGRQIGAVNCDGLPPYDRNRLVEELELFPTWYLERHLGLILPCEFWDHWEVLCDRLVHSALAQPQAFVHRDFHSCNLLLQADGEAGPGIIDFQDAVLGPVSYDLVSLVWDRYISWERQRVESWLEQFRQHSLPELDRDQWLQWCDWMGLQRNLKIVGIFCRLAYRDGKQGYLGLLPRFNEYVDDCLQHYPELAPFQSALAGVTCAR